MTFVVMSTFIGRG